MQLETWWIIVFLLAITWFAPLLGNSFFARFEHSLSWLASRRSQCLVLIFVTTVLLRVVLLPILPVPSPWVHDEFSYLLQGDIFAHGRFAFPPHPMATYLQAFYINFSPTYSSIYPPAQSAVLAVGFLLGHPWIGVLFSTAAMVAAVLWMLQGWFPPHWALLGAVFVLVRIAIFSYWMNSFWGGSVAAIGAALVLGALPRIQRRQRLQDALMLGLGVAILANSRPLEGFIFCIPIAGWLLVWLVRLVHFGRAVPVRRVLIPIAACLGLTIAFILFYNWRLTSSPWLMPHTLYSNQYVRTPLFIWQQPLPPLHYSNPQFEGFFNVWMPAQFHGARDVRGVSAVKLHDLWIFFIGLPFSLPFLTLPWLLPDRRIRLFLVQLVLSTAGLLAVTWFNPHYAAPLLCVFIAVLVQAVRHLRRWSFRGRPIGVGWTRALAILLLIQIPACAIQVARLPNVPCCNDMIHGFEREQLVRQLENTPGQHLVIVRYGNHHQIHKDWVFNAADIDHSRVVWAREIPGVDLAPLLAYYSSRRVWIAEPDTKPPLLYPYSPGKTTTLSVPPTASPTSSSLRPRAPDQTQ